LWQYLVEGPVRVVPPDPWAGNPPDPGDPLVVDPVVILEAALGGSVVALEAERAEIEKMAPEKAAEAIIHAVSRGVEHGLRGLGSDMVRYAESIEKLARSWTSEARK
jgi:hypothetical protein